MIKNDRQLAATREQLARLRAGAPHADGGRPGVHPLLAEAGRQALEAQADELQAEIEDYQALRDGTAAPPDLLDLGTLHRDLIRARVAAGLSQAELGRRVGVDAQQIQRYEATGYAGASLSRLREVAAALGGPPASTRPGAVTDEASLRRRLSALGLPAAAARRLAPGSDRPRSFGTTAAAAAQALGVPTNELLAPEVPRLVAARPGFKIPGNAVARGVAAYATYGRVLAGLVARACRPGDGVLPRSPDAVRAALPAPFGVGFRELVEYAWDHGVAVLPLKDPGAFHAAFWDVDGTGIVLLKQGNRSAARWAFDLAHELSHAADHASGRRPLPEGVIDDETVAGWADDPEEQRANRYAARVLLGPSADELAENATERAGRLVPRLKAAVARTAAAAGVSPAALANYVAFRLAQQGIDWWGAASNMQGRDEDPWRVARDVLLARVDFGLLDEQARGLLVQSLSE